MLSTHESNKHRSAYYDLVEREKKPTFHLVVTYRKNRKCFQYPTNQDKKKDISAIFSVFYMSRLLPYIMNTRKYTKDSIKHLQPITYAFAERHKDREELHHHAVICADKSTASRLEAILDRQLITRFPFTSIQSIFLTKRRPCISQYASKNYKHFEDAVLTFANKDMLRDRHK